MSFPFLSPEPALAIPFLDNKFPSNIYPKVPTSVPRNPPLCYLVSFLIVLVIPFSKILESSRAGTIFVMSFIFSFEIIKVVVSEPCIFFWIPAAIAETAAVIPNGAKMFFFFAKRQLLSLMDLLVYLIMILKTFQIELL